MDPKQTLALLDELERSGFTDEAFWRLHHFRGKKRVTINRFRYYCKRPDSFRPDHNKERVHKRIEIVLKNYKTNHAGNPAIFPRLADEAYRMIPPVPSQRT
jgi:hypothetical protein